ncbi:MAG: mannonate dehydratase [Candidatus Latescibacteria bacterium]|nr:mannonate dehydratase [Candidatus Latescibacterota bacterium]
MIKLAYVAAPEPNTANTLMKQVGVTHAVYYPSLATIPNAPEDQQPWGYAALARAKAGFEAMGMQMSVIEGRPPMEKIKLGQPGRDEEIEVVNKFLRNMGALKIPVWCSMWMPILGVIRTAYNIPTRAGAQVSAFDHARLPDRALTAHGVVSEEEQWANLKYFLEKTVPVAEEAGVKMAMHPDDPPLSPIRGVARIISTVENYQRMLDLVPSPMNGIGLCQGNFALMTKDLPAVIRHFGKQGKIHFVHFRDVRGTPDNFVETFHDDGQTDLLECLRAYRDVGYEGVMRPDHYPKMGDADFNDEHTMARLFAVGYIKGLREAVYGKIPE